MLKHLSTSRYRLRNWSEPERAPHRRVERSHSLSIYIYGGTSVTHAPLYVTYTPCAIYASARYSPIGRMKTHLHHASATCIFRYHVHNHCRVSNIYCLSVRACLEKGQVAADSDCDLGYAPALATWNAYLSAQIKHS